MFRLPCSHDKRRDNFDFPHYVWTKVRGKVSAFLKMYALARAAEIFSREVSAFFGGQLGAAEDRLTELEDRWQGRS